jgi:hypothetical protein
VRYFWDGQGLTGKAWQKQLGLQGPAWDVYFLFAAQASWQEKPSKPFYWSHQLNAVRDKAPWFDRAQLEKKTNELLALIHN